MGRTTTRTCKYVNGHGSGKEIERAREEMYTPRMGRATAGVCNRLFRTHARVSELLLPINAIIVGRPRFIRNARSLRESCLLNIYRGEQEMKPACGANRACT